MILLNINCRRALQGPIGPSASAPAPVNSAGEVGSAM